LESKAVELKLSEGFEGQEMFVIPRPVLADARLHPLVRGLYPTDIGWYPAARYHYRARHNGAPEDHLMMCLDGHGYVVVNDRKSHLQAGELVIIPRNNRHTYWAAEDRPWSIYWMHFRGLESSYYVDRIPSEAEPVAIDDSARDEAVRLFRDCLETLESGYALPTLIYAAQSARHILSVLLFRNSALPIRQRTNNHRLDCDAIIEFMHSRLSESVRLEEFANEAGLSVSYFSELFREQVHQSPLSYFTQLKIRAACRLLDLSDKPIKVVAAETGYSDPYYFSRVFKKVMGLSPEKYRAIEKG
jgi:AraC family transcriptional regulator of arabinose operon